MKVLKKLFPLAFAFSSGAGKFILGLLIHLGIGAVLAIAAVIGMIISAPLVLVFFIGFLLMPVILIIACVGGCYLLASVVIEFLLLIKVLHAPEEQAATEQEEQETLEQEAF